MAVIAIIAVCSVIAVTTGRAVEAVLRPEGADLVGAYDEGEAVGAEEALGHVRAEADAVGAAVRRARYARMVLMGGEGGKVRQAQTPSAGSEGRPEGGGGVCGKKSGVGEKGRAGVMEERRDGGPRRGRLLGHGRVWNDFIL